MSIRRATPEEFERLTGPRGSVYFGTTPRQRSKPPRESEQGGSTQPQEKAVD
jgi:hypothetical protein